MSREKKLNFEVIVEGVVVNYKKTEFPAGELQVSFLSDEVPRNVHHLIELK